MPRLLDVQQAVFEFLPKPGGGPVLDGEAGTLGDPAIVAAVEALQLVAEVQGGRPAVAAFAEIFEVQPESFADAAEPLEVGGTEAVRAAIDSAFGTHQLRITFAVYFCFVLCEAASGGGSAGTAIDDAQFIEQDL